MSHLKERHKSIMGFDVVLDVPAGHYSIKLAPINKG